ncbi:DUF2786 domain-containing protein [Allokutzneria sp. NRRL B-24872]|uniref:DUF2786 domain-containing protein n=1 Tax=Allokutzneria sp. NRRL B-24872 TaxID=1137961 RepID=UPI000A35F346|nr:DUF2786 domain-containing protein [Allokutzneria sp. NRRL B-24872]
MGKRTREKRAAKAEQRARRHDGPIPPSRDSDGPDVFMNEQASAEEWFRSVRSAVRAAAQVHLMHGPDAAAGLIDDLVVHSSRVGVRDVHLAVDRMLLDEVGHLWRRGWLPVDAFQFVRRRAGREAASLLVDVVAAENSRHAVATVHPRWRSQLAEIGATVWWERSEPLLSQWARRHGHDEATALTAAAAVLGDLAFTPATTPSVPPPGSAQDASRARSGVDEKVLSRVRGLLAKAESTDFPDEAEALSAKAQELMNRYALDRAAVEVEEQAPPAVAVRRIWLDSPYVAEKGHLVSAVAGANRCRSVLAEKPGYLTVVGDEFDLDSTELLATSLLVQANRAMLAEGKRTGQAKTRSYRQSFLISYGVRIGERLHTVTELDDSVSRALVPVFAAREQAVDNTVDELFPQLKARDFTVRDATGWAAGHAAADRARLTLEREQLR